VNLKLRGQFGQRRPVLAQRRQRYPGLNSSVCVRRMRRPDFLTIENSFSPGHPRPSFLPGVSTYRTVQICEATSQLWSFAKVKYRGLAKNLARAQIMFALASLYQVRRQLLPAGPALRYDETSGSKQSR
jgi:hypothetical protein